MVDKGQSLQRFSGQHPVPVGANGPGRPRGKSEEMTDLIDTLALEHGERMASMALQALIDGMGGKDLKQRIDAAKAYLHNFHQPSKQIDLNVNEQVTISQESREAADNMTAEERLIVESFQRHVLSMRPEEIEVAEVVEEDALPPLPPAGDANG